MSSGAPPVLSTVGISDFCMRRRMASTVALVIISLSSRFGLTMTVEAGLVAILAHVDLQHIDLSLTNAVSLLLYLPYKTPHVGPSLSKDSSCLRGRRRWENSVSPCNPFLWSRVGGVCPSGHSRIVRPSLVRSLPWAGFG